MMSHTRRDHSAHAAEGTPHTIGHVLHSGRTYDLLAWLLLGGRERAFRQKILDLARLTPADAVLDVGCGTGTLAIFAKEQVAATSEVCGIDASAEMIARATRKAKASGVDVTFKKAVVEAIPFPDGTFDVVLSTLVLHHLPPAVRAQCAREMRRVAKPRARIVVVDFGATERAHRTFLERFHRHGRLPLSEIIRVVTDAGLTVEESGPMDRLDLQFVVARAP